MDVMQILAQVAANAPNMWKGRADAVHFVHWHPAFSGLVDAAGIRGSKLSHESELKTPRHQRKAAVGVG